MRTLSHHWNLVAALLLVLLAMLLPRMALADSEARQGADWVRTTARPCTNEAVLAILANIDKDAHLDYRQASAEFQGVRYAPCWRPHGNGIWLQYEDGDNGIIPQRELKPMKEA